MVRFSWVTDLNSGLNVAKLKCCINILNDTNIGNEPGPPGSGLPEKSITGGGGGVRKLS